MPNTTTLNCLKAGFTKYLQTNFDYDFIKVQEHAELTFKNDSKEYLAKFIRRSDYVIDRVFDLIADCTEIDFDEISSLIDVDFESILDKDYEYGDGAADIYFYSLYQSCNLFSDEVEDTVQDFDKMELWKTIQIAQFSFYASFYRWSIESLQSFLEEAKLNQSISTYNNSFEESLIQA
jgi:hypothetical protein